MATAKIKAPKPMAHQSFSLKFMGTTPIVFDMSDPGTGKTFVEIMAFVKRRRARGGCMLVMAPKSLLDAAWQEDFKKFAPDMTCSIATAEIRDKAFALDADVYITNIDAAVWLAKQPKGFFKKFDTIVVDESTAFKHHTSARTKALQKIKKYFEYRSALSGTPNPNSITDVWSQVFFLDDGRRLGSSFFAFRNAVCQPVQVGPRKEMVKWEDKDGAEESVFSLLADITIRHKFEDCIDIPENFQYTVPYTMPTKQGRTYREMALTQMAALGKMKVVSAINAAAVTTKLLQIASGAVYQTPDDYHVIDTGRYEMVMDLVEERKHSIVFFLWKHQRDLLIKESIKRGIKFCVLDGTTSSKARDEMIRDYQNGFYQVIFAHPQSAAHGLTLTRATATIWPSPTYNLEHFVQGNKRAFRNGQTQKTETIVVIAKDTIEDQVYEKMLKKGKRMTNLLELFSGAF